MQRYMPGPTHYKHVVEKVRASDGAYVRRCTAQAIIGCNFLEQPQLVTSNCNIKCAWGSVSAIRYALENSTQYTIGTHMLYTSWSCGSWSVGQGGRRPFF